MIKFLKIEFLKDKRTVIPKLIFLFPFFIFAMVIIFFSSTGYTIESAINQWSFYGINLFSALLIGLIDRREKRDTQYKTIISSPIDLKSYTYSRILHGIVINFLATLIFILIAVIVNFILPAKVSILNCIVAILEVFISSVWMVPLYTWLSLKTNMYITLVISGLSTISVAFTNLLIGKFIPFNWAVLSSVPWIKLLPNGVPTTNNVNFDYWEIICSLILLVILSILTAHSFSQQVVKNDK